MKILLAGILGGVVMFIWTSIAHMALPLGEAGLREIPNESAVLGAMQNNIGEQTGLYIFPAPGVGKNSTLQEKNEAMKHMGEKWRRILPAFSCIMRPGARSRLANGSESNSALNCSKRSWSCSSSPRHASRVSPAESASFWLPEYSPLSLPTFLIGTGMASLVFTPPATCSSRSSASFLWESLRRSCCERPRSDPRPDSVLCHLPFGFASLCVGMC